MKPLDIYRHDQQTPNWTRIEMLLAAFDGVIERLQAAEAHLAKNEELKAQPFLVRAQRIVLELYSGLDLTHGAVPENMRQLYLFVLNNIGLGESLNLPDAIEILGIIRGSLESVRVSANQFERTGGVPHVPFKTHALQDALA